MTRLATLARPVRSVAAVALDGGVRFQVIGDVAGFRALAGEWRDLHAACGAAALPFQSFAFLDGWIAHYLVPGMRLAVVTAWRGESLVFGLPLVIERRHWITRLGFMGLPVAQYCDALIDPAAGAGFSLDLMQLASELGADLFELPKVGEGAALYRLGLDGAAVLDRQLAPRADLAARVDGEGPGPAYSAKARSNYRRWLRRLADDGELAIMAVPPGPKAAEAAAQAIRFKRGWLERNAIVSPVVFDPRFEGFFTDLAGGRSCDAGLRVTVLKLGTRTMGVELSFDAQDRTFGHVLALDPDAIAGAGQVLIHASFAAARRRGRAIFDLNAPADPYKMAHADDVAAVTTYVFTPTWRGWLYSQTMLKLVAPAARRLVHALPRSAARLLIRRLMRRER